MQDATAVTQERQRCEGHRRGSDRLACHPQGISSLPNNTNNPINPPLHLCSPKQLLFGTIGLHALTL
jgi:hypothetical protein